MADTCPICGASSEPGTPFCTECGQPLAVAAQPPRRRSRGRSCLLWLVIVAMAMVVIAAAVTALYVFAARPPLESYLLEQVLASLEDLEPTGPYEGGVNYLELTERFANDAIQVPPSMRGILRSVRVSFEQDRASLTLDVLSLQAQISADASATADGDVLVHDARARGLAWLVFSPATIEDRLAGYLNRQLLHPANIRLLAVQITEDRVWLAYESR